MNPFCWCVRIKVLERLCQIIRQLALAFLPGLNSRIAQVVSKNRHDGHAKLGTWPRDFRSNLALRWVRGLRRSIGAAHRLCFPSEPPDAGQPGIAHRTRAEPPRQ
jgi:hypothetical protein